MEGEKTNESAEEINDLNQLQTMANEQEPETEQPDTEQVKAEEQGTDELPTDEVLIMLFKPLFEVICPNWKVTDAEQSALAGAYAPVIDKYFGSIMGVEIQAVVVTAMILAPRVGKPRIEEKKEEKPKEKTIGETQS